MCAYEFGKFRHMYFYNVNKKYISSFSLFQTYSNIVADTRVSKHFKMIITPVYFIRQVKNYNVYREA